MQDEKIKENEAAPNHPIVERSMKAAIIIALEWFAVIILMLIPFYLVNLYAPRFVFDNPTFIMTIAIVGYAFLMRFILRKVEAMQAIKNVRTAPAPGSLDATLTEGVTFIVDKSSTAEPPSPAPQPSPKTCPKCGGHDIVTGIGGRIRCFDCGAHIKMPAPAPAPKEE